MVAMHRGHLGPSWLPSLVAVLALLVVPPQQVTSTPLVEVTLPAHQNHRCAAVSGEPVGFNPHRPGEALVITYNKLNFALWDTYTGQHIRTFTGHTRMITSVAFSPHNASELLSGSCDGIILWDKETGRPIRRFTDSWTDRVAFNPHNVSEFLSGSVFVVQLWDKETGRPIRTFSVPGAHNASEVLSVSLDAAFILWDKETGRQIRRVAVRTREVNSVPRNAGSWKSPFLLWGYDHAVFFSCSYINPHACEVLSVSSFNVVKLWDGETGKPTRTFTGHAEQVSSVAFNPHNASEVLSGSWDSALILWDKDSGHPIWTHRCPRCAETCFFNPHNESELLLGSQTHFASPKLWGKHTGRPLYDTWFTGNLAWSPIDGREILAIQEDLRAVLIDAATGRTIRTFTGHTNQITGVAFNPHNASEVLSGSLDGNLILWDKDTGRPIRTFLGHIKQPVHSVAFNPLNASEVLSVSVLRLTLWNKETGQRIRNFAENLIYSGNSVAFSPHNASEVLSGSVFKPVLWDKNTGERIRNFDGLTGRQQVTGVAFSPHNASEVLSGSKDWTLVLWDKDTGRPIRRFTSKWADQRFPFTGVAFNPHNASEVLSVSRDVTLILWDKETGEVRHELTKVLAAAYHPTIPDLLLVSRNCRLSLVGPQLAIDRWRAGTADSTSQHSKQQQKITVN